MQTTTYDMIIIGAGISGLSMAFEAKQAGLTVLLLEKEMRSGGCFHSATANHAKRDFWLEMGTHTCFNSYGRLLHILQRLDMMDQLQERKKLRYRLWIDDALYSIPSRLHFVELITHAWRIFSLKKHNKSVADYYGVLVGEKNYTEVFQHALSAVVCQPVHDMPADMLFRKRPRDKSITRSYTFGGGLSDIIHALEQHVSVKHDQHIQSIQHNDHYTINTTEMTYQCNTLVCATPALAAARLLKDVHPDIAEQLNWINEVEIESVGVVIKATDLTSDAIAGIIAIDDAFYSAVSRDYLDHPYLRGFTFHFKPGLLNQDEKTQRICHILQIDPDDIQHIFHKTNRLPAPDMGHHALTEALDAALDGSALALIGNYFDGIAVEDCLQRVEKECTRLLAPTASTVTPCASL